MIIFNGLDSQQPTRRWLQWDVVISRSKFSDYDWTALNCRCTVNCLGKERCFPPLLDYVRNLIWSVVLDLPHEVPQFLWVLFLVFTYDPEYFFEVDAELPNSFHLVIPAVVYLPAVALPPDILQAQPAPEQSVPLQYPHPLRDIPNYKHHLLFREHPAVFDFVLERDGQILNEHPHTVNAQVVQHTHVVDSDQTRVHNGGTTGVLLDQEGGLLAGGGLHNWLVVGGVRRVYEQRDLQAALVDVGGRDEGGRRRAVRLDLAH